jgi:putative transposase
MAKKGYTPEQIINKLREAEILLSQGAIVAVVSKKIGVSDYTYYWESRQSSLSREVPGRMGISSHTMGSCETSY